MAETARMGGELTGLVTRMPSHLLQSRSLLTTPLSECQRNWPDAAFIHRFYELLHPGGVFHISIVGLCASPLPPLSGTMGSSWPIRSCSAPR